LPVRGRRARKYTHQHREADTQSERIHTHPPKVDLLHPNSRSPQIVALPYDIRSLSANRVPIGTYTICNGVIRRITLFSRSPLYGWPPAGVFEFWVREGSL
jgi:hypothetical protein